jgi:hypothetical protein
MGSLLCVGPCLGSEHGRIAMAAVIWWAAKATFVLFCLLGATLFMLWLAAVAMSARVETRQARRRPHRYRVGEVIKP